MEHRYPLFVAYASLAANFHLKTLLAKYKIPASGDVIRDAAMLGQQQAFERLFPGLVRLPFAKNPLEDVIMALRYEFEDDPENLLPEAGYQGGLSESKVGSNYQIAAASRAAETRSPEMRRDSSAVNRLPSLSPQTPPPTGPSDSTIRRALPSSTEVPRGIQPTKLDPNATRAAVFPWEKKR